MRKSLLIASLAVISMNVLGMANQNNEDCLRNGDLTSSTLVQTNSSDFSAQNQADIDINNQLFNKVIYSIIHENQIYIQNSVQLINLCMQNRYLSKHIFDFFAKNSMILDDAFSECMANPGIQEMYQTLMFQNEIIQEGVPKFLSDLLNRVDKLDSCSDSTTTEEETKSIESQTLFLNEMLWSAFQNNQFLTLKNALLLNIFSEKVEYSSDPELHLLNMRVDMLNNLMFECNELHQSPKPDEFLNFFKQNRQHMSNLQTAIISARDENISDLLNQIAAISLEDQLYFEKKMLQNQPKQANAEPIKVQDGRDQASTSTAIYNEKTCKYEEPTHKSDKFESSVDESNSVEHKKDKGKRPYEDSEDETDNEFQPRVKRAK